MEWRLFFYTIFLTLLLIPLNSSANKGDSLKIAELNSTGTQLAIAGDFDGAVNAFLSILEIDSRPTS